MIIVVSSLTGRTLFTMDVDDGVVMLRQEPGSADDLMSRDSHPDSARIPSGHLLGIGLFRRNQTTADDDYPGSTKEKEK